MVLIFLISRSVTRCWASSWSKWWKYNDPHLWFVNCGNCDIKFLRIKSLDILARSATLNRFWWVQNSVLTVSPQFLPCVGQVAMIKKSVHWVAKFDEIWRIGKHNNKRKFCYRRVSGENWKHLYFFLLYKRDAKDENSVCCPKDSRRGWVVWNEFDSSAYHANHGPWGCERWASTSGAGLLKCLKWIKWQIYDRSIFWYSFSGPVRCWKMLAVSDALCLIVPLQSLATCLCFIVQESHLSWKHQDWTIADQQSL